MKKIYLTSIFLLLGIALIPTTAQERTETETSHWSFGVKGGPNFFRVAPETNAVGGRLNRLIDAIGFPTAVATLEYSFNPLFGIGVDAGYYEFNRGGALGNTIDGTVFGSLNLTNLLIRERKGIFNRFNVYTNLGIGVNLGSYTLLATNTKATSPSLVVPTTFVLDYRLSRKLSLGAEAQYRYYFNERLGGLAVNGLGSDAFVGMLSLRYKFGARSKPHVRNMTVAEFYPTPVPVIIEKIVEKAVISDAELNRFKAIEDKNAKLEAEQAELKKKLADVNAANQIIEERTSLNVAESRRIKAVEDMNALLFSEVMRLKDQDRSNAAMQGTVTDTIPVVTDAQLKSLQENQEKLTAQFECLKKAISETKVEEVKIVERSTPNPEVLARITALEEELNKLKKAIDDHKCKADTIVVQKSDSCKVKDDKKETCDKKCDKKCEKKCDKKCEKKDSCAIDEISKHVKFHTNSSVLTTQSHATLDKLVEHLKKLKDPKLTVKGHTDNVGSVAANKRLSLARANAVKAYLVSKGIAAADIKTVGVGPDKPIATNNTPEGRAQNRRVEIKVNK